MAKPRLLIMDVDGTLTDGKIYMSAAGESFKAFNIKDGYAIREMLPGAGIAAAVITGRESQIVAGRCRELGIRCVCQGCADKVAKLEEVAERFGLRKGEGGVYGEIAYIGDDLNDLPCMKRCGLTGCPADAAEEVKGAAQFVSARNGGDGAVRDFIEWILRKGKA